MLRRLLLPAAALVAAALPAAAQAVNPDLPFDFEDSFYLANGVDPAQVLGRSTGSGPNSVLDDRENGPNLNNVRLLQNAAAFDHSGHPIYFYVTGVIFESAFTDDAAGAEAFGIAEEYQVYEFPRADNGPFSVFPKRRDLIADLRGGYFSNNPLGL